MAFVEYDTVIVVGRDKMGPPYNGMRGFIDTVHGDNLYTLVALSNPDGIIGDRTLGEGACEGKYLRHDNGVNLVDKTQSILNEREDHYTKVMGAYYLKKIIEDE